MKKDKQPKQNGQNKKRKRLKNTAQQKVRSISIRLKMLIPTAILVAVICVALGLSSYYQVKTTLVSMGMEEADMAATVAASNIDGSKLALLSPGSEDTAGYKTLYNELTLVRQMCSTQYLYTLYTDGSSVYYGVDVDPEDPRSYGELFPVPYSEISSVFEGENYVQDYIDSDNLISAYQPIRDASNEIVAAVGCDYNASSVVQRLNDIRNSIFLIAVAAFLIALFLINVIIAGILRSLTAVNNKVYDLVHNEGDLTQKLDVHSGDETELIANNINQLLEHIRGIMLNIAGNSKELHSSSQTVVDSLTDAGDNISDVSSTMEQMSSSMEEISVSLNEVNQSVVDVSHSVEEISTRANQGRSSSEQIMTKAASIHAKAVENQQAAREQAAHMSDSVNQKITRSQAVSEINALTTNIISITEETSLLALNASIEAARAGEAGRGFAVVADEIGKLATNSAIAASQIQTVSNDVIAAVNDLASESAEMLRFLDEVAMSGYQELLETSENYQNDIGNLNQLMHKFASDSEQVTNNVNSIREAISNVNIAVEESAQSVTNITEKSVNLSSNVNMIGSEANSNMNIANQLNGEVHKFKL